MKFRNVISGPIFCADAPDVVIETADAAGIDVRLSISGFVWQFALSPVAEQSGYVATIKTRDILEALIEPSSIGSGGVSGVPVVEISAGADTESSISMSFLALYGSAAGKTPADMARHWLTWRDQISATYFGCRERLTFLAGLDLLGWKSGSYTVAVKIYTPSGIVQATLASGTIPSQVSYISVDASPASVLAVGEVSNILAYDLSFSLSGTAADDTAATVESYPLRLVLGAADPRAKEFIFINSLGVEDRVTACGIRKDGLEGGSSKFVNGGVEREHGNEAQEQFEVYSGNLATARSVEQWMEFLKSSERYLSSGGLKGIVIDDYNTEVQEGELCSVSFTYRLSERIKGFHHDDSESIGEYDPTQKYGALVVGDVPDATTPAAEDLFFLKTRLDEFPLVSLSEDYLLLVQSPVSYHWGAASLDSVKNWIQKTIDHNGISLAAVWASLSKTVPDTYANELISEDHIPALPQSKVTGLPDALSSLRASYTGISALIPQAATADNQLADKEFVNSSIATAMATFRGTFATLAALEATPADRNDYAFWAHKDADGNTCYDKYTWDGSAWKFEYRLNNSSFTADQWGAINSGITGALVTKLSGIATGAQVNVIETVKLGGTAVSLVTTGEKYTWNNKQAAISDLATIRTNAATAFGWGDHSKAGYITGITKAMVESVLTGNITSHTHTFDSLTSKPTTLAGYGITDANRIFRYTIPASGNKGVRITFSANEPVKITVSGSNQHAQLVLVGTGHGEGGFTRNNFTELVHSDSGYSWCMPDEACSVEVFSTRIASDWVTVESPSPVTFTAISALSTSAVNRRLLTAANYSSFALPLTGGTLSGWLLINASTLSISDLTVDGALQNTTWNRAQNVNLLLRSANNAMTISVGGQSNERKGIIQVGHAASTYASFLGDLYLNKFGGKVYIGEKLAYHEGNFIDGTDYISPKTTLEGYGITDWVLKYSADSPDTFKTSGIYRVSTTGTTGNGYWFNYGNVLVLRGTNTSDTIAQLAASYANSNLYYRSGTVSNFTNADHPWRLIYNSGNCNKIDVSWICHTISSLCINSPYSPVFDANNPDRWVNSNYGSSDKDYSNMPDGWQYGTVLTIGQQSYRGINGDLNAQFVWDVQHSEGIDKPGRLWWRTKSSRIGWKNWQEIYHSGNANKSDVDWACKSLTAAGDISTAGWCKTTNGLYGTNGVYFRQVGSIGEISIENNNEFCWGSSDTILHFNFREATNGKTVKNYIWHAGSSTSYATHTMGSLTVLGVIHATTGIYTDGYISARKQDTSSDIRLKTDFRPLDGALEYIRGTHFTRFRWRDGGESVGIIAQEERGREYGFLVRSHGEIGHLTYDYAASTALLGAALQEEDEKVEALKKRVKELENELNKLKQSNYANR